MEWDGIRDGFRNFIGRANWSYMAKVLLFALVYATTAKFGLLMAVDTPQATTVLPPTGIALATLLLFGFRFWPGVLVGSFLANILTNEPWYVASIIATGSTIEALTGAFLIKQFAGIAPKELLNTPRKVLALLILGASISTVVSASIGTFSLVMGGLIPWHHYPKTWLVWWVGDSMSDLLFAPLLLCLFNRAYLTQLWSRRFEAGALLVLTLVLSVFLFTYSPQWPFSAAPLPYFVLPILIWAAFRFAQAGVVFSLVIIALISAWGTISGLGPFAGDFSMESSLLLLQLFLFTVNITFLLVAASISERSRVTEELRLQSEELEKAQEKMLLDLEERKRLVRQLEDANRRITDILEDILEEAPHRQPKGPESTWFQDRQS